MSKLHIIITGERGPGRNFIVRKKTLRNVVVISFAAALLLTASSLAGIHYFKNYSRTLESRTQNLNMQLAETKNALDKLSKEKQQLASQFSEEISRLDERSRVIQTIMDTIGVNLPVEEDPEHSGGPYISPEYGEKLIYRADQYLELLQTIPLGMPVPGEISSKFGNRTDPLRKKSAFHPGIDFRGNTGDEIRATADGTVIKATSNNVLGRHIFISHGNGFETIFAHMNKTFVKKGELVKRGQVIGHIGNSGRSTGSHLHYGIRYNEKSIDPMKYLKVADLSLTASR
ncbi:MAG: M23 family metallopeptidase [Desulfobulbaceae bacterium]|nr:M23 family metallopeptidase [Desulfobulbaceae bacterium]